MGVMSDGYTLSDIQRMREEMEMGWRLAQVAREHQVRQLVGDDVFDAVSRSDLRYRRR